MFKENFFQLSEIFFSVKKDKKYFEDMLEKRYNITEKNQLTYNLRRLFYKKFDLRWKITLSQSKYFQKFGTIAKAEIVEFEVGAQETHDNHASAGPSRKSYEDCSERHKRRKIAEVKKTCEESGDLMRHTYISHLKNSGESVKVKIIEAVGKSSPNTTNRILNFLNDSNRLFVRRGARGSQQRF